MLHIFPTSANETISEDIGDYYPIFCDAFARSIQSVKTVQNALQHTNWKLGFVVYKHDGSAVFFFTIYSWKQEEILLLVISVFVFLAELVLCR